jgi:phosphatidylserine decarboxylase
MPSRASTSSSTAASSPARGPWHPASAPRCCRRTAGTWRSRTWTRRRIFYAKGQRFNLKAFLGSEELGREFAGGSLLISRLCPVDYHRFHFPVAGTPGEPRLINGFLYSVSPIALRQNLAYLWENKRMVTLVESPVFGKVAVCEIGATMVGSILQTHVPGRAVPKGEEKGLFKFGGSCVVTIFQHGRIKLDADLVQHSAAGLEVYARMGESLGVAG